MNNPFKKQPSSEPVKATLQKPKKCSNCKFGEPADGAIIFLDYYNNPIPQFNCINHEHAPIDGSACDLWQPKNICSLGM